MKQVAVARVDEVLRDQYRMMPSKRRQIQAAVFGKRGMVMVAHLESVMQEKFHWTHEQARDLGKLVSK